MATTPFYNNVWTQRQQEALQKQREFNNIYAMMKNLNTDTLLGYGLGKLISKGVGTWWDNYVQRGLDKKANNEALDMSYIPDGNGGWQTLSFQRYNGKNYYEDGRGGWADIEGNQLDAKNLKDAKFYGSRSVGDKINAMLPASPTKENATLTPSTTSTADATPTTDATPTPSTATQYTLTLGNPPDASPFGIASQLYSLKQPATDDQDKLKLTPGFLGGTNWFIQQ